LLTPPRGEQLHRYGMFLVGLMTKVIGGFFFIDRSQSGSETSLLIRIPYSEKAP
jgi:hypothetical protein